MIFEGFKRFDSVDEFMRFGNELLSRIVKNGDSNINGAANIALRVSEAMKDMPALNNRATWGVSCAEESMKAKAEKMDKAESVQRARKVPYIHRNDGWLIDSGLLALLTEIYKTGVCDDLVSYALNMILGSEKFCVAAMAQDSFHCFLTIQTKPDEVFIIDPWVSENRVLKAPAGEWALGKTFYFAAVGDNLIDLASIWMNFPEAFSQGNEQIIKARREKVGESYCEAYEFCKKLRAG